MTSSISHIGNSLLPGLSPAGLKDAGAGTSAGAPSFQNMMLQSLDSANQLQLQSEQSIQAGLLGEDITQAEVFSSIKKADLALRMMVQMRNKLLEAYNEIQKMQM
ncbi:flagellar hook-basal body protein FliE [Gimesia maris]|uniref:flagellar hook-basal body complex protein FliE n=1 Tax=Gimesia maris TaxID=122 RepID=UPI00118B0974|nr:flagellar hook-basal body complex protein FliE [Gimesia maris]QDT78748.1 flagellar hook-basal body protein FliE [Gimesia maris]